MRSKAGRYILVPLAMLAFFAFWRLITGRTPDLSLVFFVVVVSWTSTFFAGRHPVDIDAPPTRNDLIWGGISAPLVMLCLGFWIYQLAIGFHTGVLLVASDWTVSWADQPFGFAFTVAMYLVFFAVMLASLYYSWFTIREWIDERRAAAEGS